MNEFEKKLQAALRSINREIDLTNILDGEPCIGRYKILSLEGVGGQAYLFRALDDQLNRTVVIKLYKHRLDSNARKRAIQEGRALAKISDSRIAKCFGCDFAGDNPFLVLEDVDGESLDKFVSGREVSLRKAMRITRDIASAVQSVHREDLLHLDLKPSNVLIDSRGNIKLIDFGLTKNFAATQDSEESGTPAFMAPEQANGIGVDKRTDIFGIGAIFYFLISGQAPFEAEDKNAIRQLAAKGELKSIEQITPGLPSKIVQICSRCLMKDPAERFHSTQQLIAAIDSFHGYSKKTMITSFAVLTLCALFGWWQRTPVSDAPKISSGPFVKKMSEDSIDNEFNIAVEFSGPSFANPLPIPDGDVETIQVIEDLEYSVSITPKQSCYVKVISFEVPPLKMDDVPPLFPDPPESGWIEAGTTRLFKIQPLYANGALERIYVYATSAPQSRPVQSTHLSHAHLSGKARGLKRVHKNVKSADFVIPYRVTIKE